jgi:transcriptional regulator with XRE-family HTH domain
MDPDKEAFGKHLHRLMVAKGMKQSDLARAVGMARNNISTYITGKSFPSRDSLEKLALALGISADELLPEHDIRPVRGQVKAEIMMHSLPDGMAFLSFRRRLPMAIALRVLDLLPPN